MLHVDAAEGSMVVRCTAIYWDGYEHPWPSPQITVRLPLDALALIYHALVVDGDRDRLRRWRDFRAATAALWSELEEVIGTIQNEETREVVLTLGDGFVER